jgi:hypothetical protein
MALNWPPNLTDGDHMKTLHNTSASEANSNIDDLVVVGNGDLFQLLSKAASKSEGWMKSTKAMEVPGGCVLQVTTQQGDNVAEALTFVSGVKVVDDEHGGRKLARLSSTR